jgi:heme-degrading monooxygenase HmoA
MFARLTLLEVDTLRTSMDAAVERFRAEVLPRLQLQDGYDGVLVLTPEEGKAAVVSLWRTNEAADASVATGFYGESVGRFTTIFSAPPGRELYEVQLADLFSETPG